MTNAFGVVLDSASVRRATVEGVPETVIAAIYLLHERSIDEIASKLRPEELGHVIRLVGRCPSCYPPGTLEALKSRRPAPSPEPSARALRPMWQPPGLLRGSSPALSTYAKPKSAGSQTSAGPLHPCASGRTGKGSAGAERRKLSAIYGRLVCLSLPVFIVAVVPCLVSSVRSSLWL